MLNNTRGNKLDPERGWVWKFETWNSKCPKSCEDYDEDQEEFEIDAYTRVWLDPNKQMGDLMTQEEGLSDLPPIPPHLNPFEVRYA